MNGYRDTELGRLPDDWDVTQLSDLVDPARTIRYGIVQPGEYDSNGRLLIRGQDYSKGWVDADEMFRVSSSVEERYINARVKTGDLIITIVGAGTGHVEEIPSWLDAANLTQTTARIAVNPKKADSKFLKYMLLSSFGRNQVSNYLKGAAQPGLNCGDVEIFTLPLPVSIDEQKAIGASLKSIDDFIASLSQLITKKRDIQQATMQQLLTGQRRLPGFSGEWKDGELRDVVKSLEAGVSVNSSDDLPELGLPCVLKTSALSGGNFFPNEAKTIVAADRRRACTNPKRNTILISRMNTPALVGEIAYVGKDYDWLFLPDRLWMTRFMSDDCVNARWLAYLLSSRPYRRLLQDSATGTSGSMKNISKGVLLNLQISYPTIEEQTAIATILSDMDTELTALEARCEKARQLKQGMMQELLTGRIRLV
ncbi:restriction endonuclease subunit S [Stutzerimonas frequens]|uniref:restriction endonuclease subunit S n=1 Tax=Stutzerimonas frequens TaxID=2968969 RepID=UPI0022DD1981|nr:restriction endonuclease subunit S [Stutzerimonas frequens]MDA0426048.1 restriction endonuclease subunit S [Stutzerimonas frequens]